MTENEFKGWLLDIYDSPQEGGVLWFLCEDGQRRRLHQPFPVTCYAAGEAPQLRQLWRYLEAQPIPLQLSRDQRRMQKCWILPLLENRLPKIEMVAQNAVLSAQAVQHQMVYILALRRSMESSQL